MKEKALEMYNAAKRRLVKKERVMYVASMQT